MSARDELRNEGRRAGRELVSAALGAFVEWCRSKPLQRFRARRKARKSDEQKR